jgi:hypothetical protein
VSLTDETLITLKDACEMFFRGRITVAVLKAEHSKGNLEMSKIGRSYFTTLAKLKAMEAKCRVEAPDRDSGSTKSEEHGPSSTAEAAAARDSLMMKLDELKNSSGNTSLQSMSSKTAQRRSSQTF